MDSDNVMTAVHEYTITNEIWIFILDITFNKLKCLQNNDFISILANYLV